MVEEIISREKGPEGNCAKGLSNCLLQCPDAFIDDKNAVPNKILSFVTPDLIGQSRLKPAFSLVRSP